MSENVLFNGIIITIVGLSTVFIFLWLISFFVYLIKKTFKTKDIKININTRKESNLEKLEKIAVFSAALTYLQTRHSSLSGSDSDNFQNKLSWLTFNKRK